VPPLSVVMEIVRANSASHDQDQSRLLISSSRRRELFVPTLFVQYAAGLRHKRLVIDRQHGRPATIPRPTIRTRGLVLNMFTSRRRYRRMRLSHPKAAQPSVLSARQSSRVRQHVVLRYCYRPGLWTRSNGSRSGNGGSGGTGGSGGLRYARCLPLSDTCSASQSEHREPRCADAHSPPTTACTRPVPALPSTQWTKSRR
jgi:hypothetical protein